MQRLLVVVTLALIALAVACGRGSDGDGGATSEPKTCGPPSAPVVPSAGSLFANPSFEQGSEPWISLDTQAWGPPFQVSDGQSVEGSHSAALSLRSDDGGSARIYGVVQEISPDEFPQTLSGYYCVARWEKGTSRQYLQFVVIVFDAANLPAEIGGQANNYQIRYLLAGAAEQPTNISNARYVFVTQEEPVVGRWVHFERNVREDFVQLWGEAPRDFSQLRILFETRWDDRSSSDGPSAADVFYDNLYLGPPR